MNAGDLVRFTSTGEYAIILDMALDTTLKLFFTVLTPNEGYRYAFCDELEVVHEIR